MSKTFSPLPIGVRVGKQDIVNEVSEDKLTCPASGLNATGAVQVTHIDVDGSTCTSPTCGARACLPVGMETTFNSQLVTNI